MDANASVEDDEGVENADADDRVCLPKEEEEEEEEEEEGKLLLPGAGLLPGLPPGLLPGLLPGLVTRKAEARDDCFMTLMTRGAFVFFFSFAAREEAGTEEEEEEKDDDEDDEDDDDNKEDAEEEEEEVEEEVIPKASPTEEAAFEVVAAEEEELLFALLFDAPPFRDGAINWMFRSRSGVDIARTLASRSRSSTRSCCSTRSCSSALSRSSSRSRCCARSRSSSRSRSSARPRCSLSSFSWASLSPWLPWSAMGGVPTGEVKAATRGLAEEIGCCCRTGGVLPRDFWAGGASAAPFRPCGSEVVFDTFASGDAGAAGIAAAGTWGGGGAAGGLGGGEPFPPPFFDAFRHPVGPFGAAGFFFAGTRVKNEVRLVTPGCGAVGSLRLGIWSPANPIVGRPDR